MVNGHPPKVILVGKAEMQAPSLPVEHSNSVSGLSESALCSQKVRSRVVWMSDFH